MSLKAVWPGREDADTAILILVPPAGSRSWTNSATGFTGILEGIHRHFESSPAFVFEHEANSPTTILGSSRTLCKQVLDLRTSKYKNKLSRRPWLLVAHGLGGTLAKSMLSEGDFADKCSVGILLLDTPNLGSFGTYETLLGVTQAFGWTSDLSAVENDSLKELLRLDEQFAYVSSRLSPLMSVFSIQSNFDRKNMVLNLPTEIQVCMKVPSNRLGIYDDEKDCNFPSMILILQRAASLANTVKYRIVRPTSARWPGNVITKLNKYFPPYYQYNLSLHSIKSFSCPDSNGGFGVKTVVRSQIALVPDLVGLVRPDTVESSDQSQAISFRWFHVPTNHSGWVEVMHNGSFPGASQTPIATFLKFWSQNHLSARSLRLGAWQMKATCTFTGPKGDRSDSEPEGLVIIVPYLHWDTIEHLSGRERAIDMLRSSEVTQEQISAYQRTSPYANTELNSATLISDHALYLPQLLDQYKYPTISLPSNRLQKQLIPRMTDTSGSGSKTLVVQQLWLVIPNNGDVITYFPSKEGEDATVEVSQVADVENVVLDYLSNIHHPSDVCSNIYDLAALIVHATVTTLFGQTKHPDFQFMSLYRVAVGELRMKHLAALTSFRDESLNNLSFDATDDSKEENFELSLVLDVHALKSELQTLIEIIQAQAAIVQKFDMRISNSSGDGPTTSTAETLLGEATEKLQSFEMDLRTLRADAEAVERDLLRLLDLRQKRANLREAHAASLQAHETSLQTEHSLSLSQSAASQSRVVMVITLLSSIYLPLSFFSSYYGMNLKDITGDDGNPGTVKDYWKLAGPISVGATLIALIVGFRNPLEIGWKKLRTKKKSWPDEEKKSGTNHSIA